MAKRKITISKKAKHWKEKFPLVAVHWFDISADASWHGLKELQEKELPVCVSKGHLFSQKKGVTRIFGDYSEDGEGNIDEIGNSTIIPNSVIKDIEKL